VACVGFEEGVEELWFCYKKYGVDCAMRLEIDIDLPCACFPIHSFHEKHLY